MASSFAGAGAHEDPAVLVSTEMAAAVASSCGIVLLVSGLVATTSFLATIRQMWPFAFLVCSMAAALAASRKADEEDSWVSLSHIGQRARPRSRRRTAGSSGAGVGVRIEALPYPKELKEWVYPAQ